MSTFRTLTASSIILAAFASAGFAATPTTLQVDILDGNKLPLAVKLDKTEAKAGPFIFQIQNQAGVRSEAIIIAKLKSADAQQLANIKNDKIDMANFKRVAQVDGIRAHDRFTVRANLKAGDYLLLYRDGKGLKSATESPLVVSN